jgi:hypothetical protein
MDWKTNDNATLDIIAVADGDLDAAIALLDLGFIQTTTNDTNEGEN